PSGMINSIGLENPGLEEFVRKKLPVIRKLFKIPVIVSIGGKTSSEFIEIVKKLNNTRGISGYELNLSCPNIRKCGVKWRDGSQTWSGLISQDTELTYEIVSAVRKNTKLPIIAKLSPAVTDIAKIATVCKDAGADAVSLINSYPAVYFASSPVFDANVQPFKQLPIHVRNVARSLSPIFGGLSGPAIKPIALRMVYEVARQVKIPIMGVGGIASVEDAIEFFSAGASTIGIGSGIFKDPKLPEKIIDTLKNFKTNG
ncbi:MAG: DUF561 domain-containing protein, partial [Elusimicrobiota bacterium]|nr:DUF561 domain-containing protein [Elusimicrobiota bacterium]